jgi:predicted protein tyrosine phosphatase
MDANEIVPGLWLGNINASQDDVFLNTKGIHAVFNCTKNIPFVIRIPKKYRLPVDDNLQEEEIRNMELWSFEVVYKLIQELKEGPVLVHCHAGVQRSAAVVAMYLIATKGLKTQQAIQYIKDKRPIAFTHQPNFLRAIESFEKMFDRDIRPRLVNKESDLFLARHLTGNPK